MDDWDDPSLSYDGQPSAPHGPVTGAHLGQGAQGVVVSGQDRHLPREVAWKTAPLIDPKACSRLRHEARVLAMLEHPNIVPVYDLDDLGTHLRMALRYVRGASLRTLMRREPFAPGSVRAIRHVLAVAHALAFAHLRGVVHRDVKPDNIMVGEQGETQLIDWGLAAVLDDHDPVGAVSGTPLYMSPEQARGERPTPAVDVWALGAILYELAVGRPLWALSSTPIESGDIASDTKPLLDALRLGRLPHLDLRDLPDELAAIIIRALAPEPEARYPDAAAFADDLEAFLDGRIVAAHTYSRWQRLKRFAKRWRVAFGVGLAVLVTLAIGLPLAFLRISDERDDAIAARQEVTRMLGRAETTIAQREHEAGRRPEAELAAAKVLALTESPEARGVLAAWARAPRPRAVLRAPASAFPESCRDLAVSPNGRYVLCGQRSRLTVSDLDGGTPRTLLVDPRAYFTATVTDDALWVAPQNGPLERIDFATRTPRLMAHSGRDLVAFSATGVADFDAFGFSTYGTTSDRTLKPEDNDTFQSAATDGETMVILDSRGRLTIDHPDQRRVLATPFVSATREYLTLAFQPGPGRGRAVIGSSRGTLALVDLDDGTVLCETALHPERMIRRLAIDPAHNRLLAQVDQLGAVLLDLRSLALVTRLPTGESTFATLLSDGRIATFGDTLRLRDLPDGPVAQLEGYIGVTSLTLAPPNNLLVTHERSVSVVDLDTGEVGAAKTWIDPRSGVVKKALARGPDLVVAVSDIDNISTTYDPSPPDTLNPIELHATRRLEALPDGRFVRASSGDGLDVELPDGTLSTIDPLRQIDIALTGPLLVGLTSTTPRTSVWDLSGPPRLIARCPDTDALAVALATSPDGPIILTAHPRELRAFDTHCALVQRWPIDRSQPTRVVAFGPTETGLVIAGTSAGELLVWDWTGRLRARVDQHVEPVSALILDPSHRWVLSGAWDGRVRFLDLAAVQGPAAALIAQVHAAWSPEPPRRD